MIIICFPPAGGGSGSFAKLRAAAESFAECVTVELPGRMSRLAEPPATSIDQLAEHVSHAVLDVIEPRQMPYAFLGLCLGAVMAYETAARIEATKSTGLRAMIAAGSNAPQACPPAVNDPVEFLRRMGSPDEVFESSPLLEMTVEILRSDLRLLRAYTCSEKRLRTPLHVMYGLGDSLVQAAGVEQWKDLTEQISIDAVPGGHLFLDQNVGLLFERLFKDVAVTPDRKKILDVS